MQSLTKDAKYQSTILKEELIFIKAKEQNFLAPVGFSLGTSKDN